MVGTGTSEVKSKDLSQYMVDRPRDLDLDTEQLLYVLDEVAGLHWAAGWLKMLWCEVEGDLRRCYVTKS